jgi:hypothetical protein
MSELYESIRKKASQLFPEDEKAQAEFVEGFITKTASVFDDLKYSSSTQIGSEGRKSSLGSQFTEGFWARGVAQAAGKALVGAGAATIFASLGSMYGAVQSHKLYNAFLKSFREVMNTNRVIKAAGPEKALNYAHTIFKFAPHVATDANLLSSVLANAIHGEGIDPMTIRSLTELESKYSQSKGDTLFNPKSWT